jgi:hypothetical protein
MIGEATSGSFLCEARRALAQFVNTLRRVCLREGLVEFFACVSAQGLQVGPLRGGHRFITGLPLVRITLKRRLVCIISLHETNG